MATGPAVGQSQLQRIIQDLHDAVAELSREFKEGGEPITDDSSNLHKFSYKLEYLLQFDQKEKTTFLGTRKDYWDYFSDCLVKVKGANDGIRFVKSIAEVPMSLSFCRERSCDCDWYFSRSPFLKSHLCGDIINHLYELNEVQFDVAPRGHDLDSGWPSFARRTLGMSNSPSHVWKAPSRSSSISSLASSYSQVRPGGSPDFDRSGLLGDRVGGDDSCLSAVDELRLELDQSELCQHELVEKVTQMGREASELRSVLQELQRQLDISLEAQANHQQLQRDLEALEQQERILAQELLTLRVREAAHESSRVELQEKLTSAEKKNNELMAKLDVALEDKGQRAASHFSSAQKIHELLDELKEAEQARMEALGDAEERRRQVERLNEELKAKEEVLRETQKRTDTLKEEFEDLRRRKEEQHKAAGFLQGELGGREKEARELQEKLNQLKCDMEIREREVKQEKKTLIQKLEAQKKSEEVAIEALTHRVNELDCASRDQARKMEEYKVQCSSLMELNSKLMAGAKKAEEARMELAGRWTTLEEELSALQTSEKQLRSHIDDAAERERRLCEKNQGLDEELQKARMQVAVAEVTRRLEEENQELRGDQTVVKAQMQEELLSIGGQMTELEKNLGASRCSEANLTVQLRDRASQIEELRQQCVELQGRVEVLQAAAEESLRTSTQLREQLERLEEEKRSGVKEVQMARGKMSVLAEQLSSKGKEVTELQQEVLQLRTKLHSAGEEQVDTQTCLEVTEATCAELRLLVEQLNVQTEELNRTHAAELLQCHQREEVLANQRDQERVGRGEATGNLEATQAELSELKAQNEHLVLENTETREGLHRANTEMAELGINLCRITAECQEARQHIEDLQACARDAEQLNASLVLLRQENLSLREQLLRTEKLPDTVKELQEKVAWAECQLQQERDARREEVAAVKFQMSSDMMSQQGQVKSLRDELDALKILLKAENERSCILEAKIPELEAVNEEYSQLIEEKDTHITKSEALIREGEEENQKLREKIVSTEEALCVEREERQRLKEKAEQLDTEAVKMAAEIEDLSNTKTNLEERLIELIKDKDALWQKTDALEFEQKLRAEEQWWLVDREVKHCLDCQGQFTWYLRRHHCRLCGRIFCYYCSNNYVLTKYSQKKERCCRECYTQHTAVVERFTPAELHTHTHGQHANYKPTAKVTVTDPNTKQEDASYDIITEEEVNGIYDSDSLSHSTAEPSSGPDDLDEVVATLQDAEINLLKLGELTMCVPLTLEDISAFGDSSREIFIKSSCYSMISVSMVDCGPTLSWVFSSEPKSISFSVVFRENSDMPVEQSKVLIPLTRCNSHQENIQGKLKVRSPGLYTLILDNSFSRFISKKVLFHLTMEKPVIYDGSDCP
uniref:Uncharacterized protein n=1 Tax=Denticeps clupeoides TaxID=299321 RepID=A0AAY4CB59_9TELE